MLVRRKSDRALGNGAVPGPGARHDHESQHSRPGIVPPLPFCVRHGYGCIPRAPGGGLFRRRGADAELGEGQTRSAEEYLFIYLRSLDEAESGLPPAFLDRLRRALAHYGIEAPADMVGEAIAIQ